MRLQMPVGTALGVTALHLLGGLKTLGTRFALAFFRHLIEDLLVARPPLE